MIAAETGVKNRNELILNGDVIEFDRAVYPLLFNHNEVADDVIGDVRISYSAERQAYLGDVTLYDTHPNIVKAVENGAFDSVSISYYLTEYELDEENEALIVNNALMNELSLVSVPADPNAKIQNGANVAKELIEEIKNNKIIEEIKKRNE